MTDTIENQEKHLYHMLIKMLYCGWLINNWLQWMIDWFIGWSDWRMKIACYGKVQLYLITKLLFIYGEQSRVVLLAWTIHKLNDPMKYNVIFPFTETGLICNIISLLSFVITNP